LIWGHCQGPGRLRAIILANADGTLAIEAISPEAVQLNIALREVGVGNEEPGTKDTLGKDVKDGIGNNLAINANPAGTVCKTPDTKEC
jgi:hypothetical protein